MTTENPLVAAGAGKSQKKTYRMWDTAEEWCDHLNGHLASIGRTDIRWYVRDNKPVLDWVERPHIAERWRKHVMDRRGEPMSQEDTDKLNYRLEQAGAKVRYDRNGGRFDAFTGEPAPRPVPEGF
jgi:hypothetical protein